MVVGGGLAIIKCMNKIDILLSKIKSAFPKLQWSDYVYMDEGWDHQIIILDGSIVFRFPNQEGYLRGLKKEIEILNHLKPLVSVRIPEYKYIATDSGFAGYPIIPGQQMTKESFDQLKPAERTEIAKQLAGFLSGMHTFTPVPDIPFYMPNDQAETKVYAAKHLPEVLNKDDYNVVQEILDDVDALLEQRLPSVLIHGDIYHNHLFWDDKAKRLGIIDFSDMSVADPATDFGEIYEYGGDFVREVYEYYRGPKDDTFLERAWTYQRWAGVYMMTDHFINHKTSFEESREIFDRTKLSSSSA